MGHTMTTEATEAYLKKFERLALEEDTAAMHTALEQQEHNVATESGQPRAMTTTATEAYLKKFEKLALDEDTAAMHTALEQDVARVHSECNEERVQHLAAREKRAAARAAREAALFRDATNWQRPSAQSKDERIAVERAIVGVTPTVPVPRSHTSSAWSAPRSKVSAGRRAMKAMGRSLGS